MSSGIPDLHFEFDAIDGDGLYLEIDPDGGYVSHFVLLVDIPEKDVGFSDGSIPDDDNFNKVIIFFLFSFP